MKHVLIIGDEPDTGSVLTSPMGGVIFYPSMSDACAAAKLIAAGPLAKRYPNAGVFVCRIAPVAFYLPVTNPDPEGKPMVDETIINADGLKERCKSLIHIY